MSDDFDAARIGIQLDRAEQSGEIDTDVAAILRKLVRNEEENRLDRARFAAMRAGGPPTYGAIVDEISRMERHRPPHDLRHLDRALGETHEAHADRIVRLVREGRTGPR